MKKQRARALITDFDNTLFDWVDVWCSTFSAMLEEILRISGVDRSVIISEIKSVHQRHGTSEYAFLIEEIASINSGHPRDQVVEKYKSAIEAFRRERRKRLKLYPGVSETLTKIKEAGIPIYTYTESLGFYSSYRVRKLGLDGLIDVLYSPEDHDIPENIDIDKIRMYGSDAYKLSSTRHLHTPRGRLKPDPIVLSYIIEALDVPSNEIVYVGDSLMKDVPMARAVGVIDVHALYGKADERPEYNLLREVTHWTHEDVEREREISRRPPVVPSITLRNGFPELLEYIDFGR